MDLPSTPVLAFEWGTFFMDNALWVTIVLILGVAIIGAFVRERKKDKCLKFFNRFTTTMVRVGNKVAWGRLKVFSKGLELVFHKPHRDNGLVKTSFLMYEAEQKDLIGLFRYHDQLGPKNRQRRLGQLRRQFRPGLVSRTWRRLRNIFNTLRDALNKAIGAMVGQAAKMNPSSSVLTKGSSQVTEIGSLALDTVANAYEPILEQLIGQPVIMELVDPNDASRCIEYEGFLADYTLNFICVMNIRATCRERLAAAAQRGDVFEGGVQCLRSGKRMTVTNSLDMSVTVTGPDGTRAVVAQDGSHEVALQLDENGQPAGEVVLEMTRNFDIVAPRKVAIVRHASGATLADPIAQAEAAAKVEATPEEIRKEKREEEALNES